MYVMHYIVAYGVYTLTFNVQKCIATVCKHVSQQHNYIL